MVESFYPVNFSLLFASYGMPKRNSEWNSLGRRSRLGRSRLILPDLRFGDWVAQVRRNPGRKGAWSLSEQPIELDARAPLKLFLLQGDSGAELLQPERRQAAVFRRKCLKHVQVIKIAKRLAKIVQSFGLRVEGFRPRAGEEGELIAQVDDPGARSVKRRRILGFKSDKAAPLRLSIGS